MYLLPWVKWRIKLQTHFIWLEFSKSIFVVGFWCRFELYVLFNTMYIPTDRKISTTFSTKKPKRWRQDMPQNSWSPKQLFCFTKKLDGLFYIHGACNITAWMCVLYPNCVVLLLPPVTKVSRITHRISKQSGHLKSHVSK